MLFYSILILYREKGTGPLEHYFTNNPNLKSEIKKITLTIMGNNFLFFSDNGVFSKNKIDYASKCLVMSFLQDKKNVSEDKTLLDVGCGYGFLGITVGKILKIPVELIDINKRAVHLASRNIKENKVNGIAYESNIYENVKNKYDYIITNPPIRSGKEVVLKILIDAKDYLKDDGELWFVINKNQGAKSIKAEIEKHYKVDIVAKSKGFYIFKAKIC